MLNVAMPIVNGNCGAHGLFVMMIIRKGGFSLVFMAGNLANKRFRRYDDVDAAQLQTQKYQQTRHKSFALPKQGLPSVAVQRYPHIFQVYELVHY